MAILYTVPMAKKKKGGSGGLDKMQTPAKTGGKSPEKAAPVTKEDAFQKHDRLFNEMVTALRALKTKDNALFRKIAMLANAGWQNFFKMLNLDPPLEEPTPESMVIGDLFTNEGFKLREHLIGWLQSQKDAQDIVRILTELQTILPEVEDKGDAF